MFELTLTLLTVATVFTYFYVKCLYSYWQRRGIPYLKPSFPFGNFGKTFIQKLTFVEQLAELYRSTSEPFIGIFMLQSPMLLIRDPHLIRSILITDFQFFTDRKMYLNGKDEPLTAQLGALRGQRWRNMRETLTPAFTPNKMKMIFPMLLDCSNQLKKHLSKVTSVNQAIEMFEVIACYASNVTASVAFGIDIDCFVNPNHPFRNAGRQMIEINLKNALRFIGWFSHTKLLKWSGIRFVDRSVEEYFLNLVAQTLEMREQQNVVRNDFFQFLIELQNNVSGTSLDDDDDDEWTTLTEKTEQKTLSIEQVAAETFGFYFGGVEATSLVTSYCLYEIAKCPDIQRKIHAEIDIVMTQYSDKLTYESINELKYLDCCIDETLRKYQLVHLSRVCVEDYKVPGTNVTIEKGTTIIIPTSGLHHDEKYYSNPKNFDPTRFSTENKATIDMPYFGFGEGPRACLGQRMGKMFAKVGIYSILQQHYIDLDDRHIGKEIKFSMNVHPLGGIHLKLTAK